MLRPSKLIAAALLCALSLPLPLLAQEKKGKGPAYTEPPENELNFPLMGEFVGLIEADGSEPELLGLQIRPVGGNQFDAVSFHGGLPGQEKFKPEPIRMIGRRSEDFVVLSGGPWAIFVEQDGCLLIDRKGNKVGQLERVQRSSPTLGARAPKGSVILFDGTSIDQFTNAQMTKDGLLMQGADVRPMFQDFNLHIEFRLPYMPEAEGQQRANSGLYLQSRYECQVLDSFALDPLINGCGALYKFKAPDLNMCLPPLVWQTYDVQFTAPRWAADGSKIRDAHITSWINGVKVQDNVALPNKTGAGKQEEPLLLPTRFQDHGDPVRFRNAWVVDRGLVTGDFPINAPTEEELAAEAKAKELKAKKQREAAEKKQKEEAMKKAAAEKKKADAAKAAMKEKAKKEAAEKKPAAEKQPAEQKKPAEEGPDAKPKVEAAEQSDAPKVASTPAS